MSSKQPTTGEAITAARRSIAAARLADPGEHFPYKRREAARALSDADLMGPAGPDDDSVDAGDFTSERIILATDAYVAAQADYLADDTEANRERVKATADDLVAARRAHRRTRVDADGNPVGAIIGTTAGASPAYLRGPRHRRIGED